MAWWRPSIAAIWSSLTKQRHRQRLVERESFRHSEGQTDKGLRSWQRKVVPVYRGSMIKPNEAASSPEVSWERVIQTTWWRPITVAMWSNLPKQLYHQSLVGERNTYIDIEKDRQTRAYGLDNCLVAPVYRGNMIKPKEARSSPEVHWRQTYINIQRE